MLICNFRVINMSPKRGKISDRPCPKNNKINDKKTRKPQKRDKNTAKVFKAKPKAAEIDDDSPFAILKQLQK